MFIPNLKGTVRRRAGTDVYGKATYLRPTSIRYGLIRLEEMSGATSVRTDSSASRGSAMEETALSRILVPANVRLRQGDEVSVSGFTLTVQSVWPRYSVAGKLDHWQLDLVIAEEMDTSLDLGL